MISIDMLHWLLHDIEIKLISLIKDVMSNGKEVEQELITRIRRMD
jgi:hypothetical protein